MRRAPQETERNAYRRTESETRSCPLDEPRGDELISALRYSNFDIRYSIFIIYLAFGILINGIALQYKTHV